MVCSNGRTRTKLSCTGDEPCSLVSYGMNIIRDIHVQSKGIRLTLWGLASFVVVSAVAYVWMSGIRRELFLAINTDPAQQQAFLERQDAQSPDLRGLIGGGVGKLTASIGNLLHITADEGFDRPVQHDTVYLLPLSN